MTTPDSLAPGVAVEMFSSPETLFYAATKSVSKDSAHLIREEFLLQSTRWAK